MTRREPEKRDRHAVDEREERLARARLAFDQGLREASETGARAVRRLIVPALWGAALVGGSLLALAMLRLVRRPSARPALLRVSVEPRFAVGPLLPAIGGAVARLALQHFLAAATSSPRPGSPGAGSLGTDEAHASLAPEATPAAPQRNGSNHSNGSSARSAQA